MTQSPSASESELSLQKEFSKDAFQVHEEISHMSDQKVKKETEYDDLGNVTKEVYYGTDGNLVNTTMGFAYAEYRRVSCKVRNFFDI